MREHFEIQESIDRIGRMEIIFDLLQQAADKDPAAIEKNIWLKKFLHILAQYYESGQWLHDYELDEQGFLPQNLKRGVLSQDGVHNLLCRIKDLQ